jgi:exodeoxyribonuclease VII large subunit
MNSRPPVYSVSQLTREVRSLLEASFASIRIEGEISNLAQPASGHKYFTLKDESAQIRCAMFRNRARFARCTLKEGQHVVITTRISLYEARGDFQCIVQSVEDAGEGQLRLKFEQLKKRLADEGLFDASRKIPLPALPHRVGVITSPSGAAVHDIISTFQRRFPATALLIHPVLVQGENAAASIAAAIQTANLRQDCDVLIIARGGGSLEDLWPFNEEIVARAIYDSTLPIISAVGHETDFSIADMVADARAPTPTASAEMLSPDQVVMANLVNTQTSRIIRSMARQIENASQRVDYSLRRLQRPEMALKIRQQHTHQLILRLGHAAKENLSQVHARAQQTIQKLATCSPSNTLSLSRKSLQATEGLLTKNISSLLRGKRMTLEKDVQTLHVLSPLATLARGYATLHNPHDNKPITSIQMTQPGERITARLNDGELDCIIETTTARR